MPNKKWKNDGVHLPTPKGKKLLLDLSGREPKELKKITGINTLDPKRWDRYLDPHTCHRARKKYKRPRLTFSPDPYSGGLAEPKKKGKK